MAQKRALIIGTSNDRMADSLTRTGAWANEIAAPYYELRARGFHVDLGSPQGGRIPLDPSSLSKAARRRSPALRRFMVDPEAALALESSNSIVFAAAVDYDAIYVAGGHGMLWDGSVNAELVQIVTDGLLLGRSVAACGHGVVALLEAIDPKTGAYIISGREVTGPTREDEEAAGMLPNVPFILEDELKKRGAVFSHADTLDLPWALRSGNLITGQNCFAAKMVAELIVEVQSFGVRLTTA